MQQTLNLTDDYVQYIFKYLKNKDIHNLQQCCSLFYKQTFDYYIKSLCFTQSSDDNTLIKYIHRSKVLSDVDLCYCCITNKGLEYIKDFVNLTCLNLCCTKITDKGLFYLKDLVNLTNNNITDEGLEHLKDLVNLTILNINVTTNEKIEYLINFISLHK